MAHSGQEKIPNGNEEFNEFEEALVRRHLEVMQGELIRKLEEMDHGKAEELLREGGYIDKGYVQRIFCSLILLPYLCNINNSIPKKTTIIQ